LDQSKAITLNNTPQVINDSIGYGGDEYDDYSFTLTNSSFIRATLNGRSDMAEISILNDKKVILYKVNNYDNRALTIDGSLGAGKYVVRINSYGSAETPYSLNISSLLGLPTRIEKSDETLVTATNISTGVIPIVLNDRVGGYDSSGKYDGADFYRIQLDKTSFLRATLNGDGEATFAVYDLLDKNGQALRYSRTVDELALQAGTYYLKVNIPWELHTSKVANYSLNVSSVEIIDIAGSELSTAKELTIGTTPLNFSEWVGGADPVDLYKFNLKEDSFFQTSLYGLTGNADFCLFDKDGKVLLNADKQQIGLSARSGTSSETVYLPLAAGTYYLKVYSYSSPDSFYNLVLAANPIINLIEGNTAAPITPIGQFRAEYFNSVDPNIGSPVLVRNESIIDYTWGIGSPDLGVNADNFSVRWTGRFNFEQGSYLFRDRADDGIRIWVDGQLVINQWQNQGVADFGAYREMTAGLHQIKVEYYDRGAEATAKVWWQKSTPWTVNYFNQPKLPSGAQRTSFETIDTPTLNFSKNWGLGAPTNTPTDRFSAQFSTNRWLPAGLYKIQTQADDGVKVTIGGQQVIDRWSENGYFQNTGFFRSLGADVPINVEYYDNEGAASLNFNISSVDKFTDSVLPNTNWNSMVFTWDVSKGDRPPVDFFNGDFNNPNVIGITNLGSNVRPDGKPGFLADWGSGALNGDATRLPNDYFAVRAYTTAQFDGGEYLFRAKADEGFQISARNKATGQWFYITPQASWEASSTIYKEYTRILPQGSYDLYYHFYEKTGNASFDLNWVKNTRISVSVKDGDASETHKGKDKNPGVFTITRAGNSSQAVEVEYTYLEGEKAAKVGVDFTDDNFQNGIGKVIIPPGQSSVDIIVNIEDDILAELEETIEMRIKPNNAYQVSVLPSINTIKVQDNEHNTRQIDYAARPASNNVKALIGTEESLDQFMLDDPTTKDVDESKLKFNEKYALKTWDVDTSSRVISYSFYNKNSGVYDDGKYFELNIDIQDRIKEIFDMISKIINVNFQWVGDTKDSWGTLRYYGWENPDSKTFFAGTEQPERIIKGKEDENILGDIFLDPNKFELKDVSIGSYGYQALIHETLHALGLKHPGNYNADSVGNQLGPFLSLLDDNLDNTIMSYNDRDSNGNSTFIHVTTPMIYDIKALVFLYGARQDSLNSTYKLSYDDFTKTRKTLWDFGGTDTIDLSMISNSFDLGSQYRIDLRSNGVLSILSKYKNTQYQEKITGKIGGPATQYGVSISEGTLIENLITSSHDDEIFANEASNTFSGYYRGRSFGNDTYWYTNSSDTLDLSRAC
jgi:hypothetical protein